MQKKIRKIVSSILASCMVISAFAGIAPQKAEAKTTLVNVAVNGTVSTQNGENGSYVIGNINDSYFTAAFSTASETASNISCDVYGVSSDRVIESGDCVS